MTFSRFWINDPENHLKYYILRFKHQTKLDLNMLFTLLVSTVK